MFIDTILLPRCGRCVTYGSPHWPLFTQLSVAQWLEHWNLHGLEFPCELRQFFFRVLRSTRHLPRKSWSKLAKIGKGATKGYCCWCWQSKTNIKQNKSFIFLCNIQFSLILLTKRELYSDSITYIFVIWFDYLTKHSVVNHSFASAIPIRS